MSDDWIVLIPKDGRFVPDEASREAAQARFAAMVPLASQVTAAVTERIEFFDCGGNFEGIFCPTCNESIPMDWFVARMQEDYDGGFSLTAYPTPCCKSAVTLQQLKYEWPQGFGRFALDAMNPNIGKLTDASVHELEEILGTPLRVIYRHL